VIIQGTEMMIRRFAALVLLVGVTSCDFDWTNCDTAVNLFISPYANQALWVGDTLAFTAQSAYMPNEMCDKVVATSASDPAAFVFSVDDPSVASITPTGAFVAKAPGEVHVSVAWSSMKSTVPITITRPVARIAMSITPADTAPYNGTVKVTAEAQDPFGNPVPEAPLAISYIFVSSPITSRYVTPNSPYTARNFSFDAIWHGSYAIALASPHFGSSPVTSISRVYVP
jgi:hypothetical protein